MIGLTFFAVVIGWSALCIWLARKLVRWLSLKYPWQRAGLGIFAFGVLFLLPLADEIVGKFLYDKLCREEAGVKIYGRLELGPEFFKSDGTPNFIDKETKLMLPANAMDAYVEYVFLPAERLPSPAKLLKTRMQFRNKSSGELLAESTAFGMYGGWLSFNNTALLPLDCPRGKEELGEIFSAFVSQKQGE
jgi:hypothetical protein